MEKSIEWREKKITSFFAVVQSTFYTWVILYFWGTHQAWWLLILMILLTLFNFLAVKFFKTDTLKLVASFVQLSFVFLIIFFSGHTESPFYPMYYLPVVAAVAFMSENVVTRNVLIVSSLATVTTFANILMMPTITFTEIVRGLVISTSYFVLSYSVMFHNLKLKQSILDSTSDYLTGVTSRKVGEKILLKELNTSKKSQKPVVIVFCDLDNFKKINDTYGHLYGDEVLREVTQILKQELPEDAPIIRWGGEEFLLLFTGWEKKEVNELMEQIRKRVETYPFQYKDKGVTVTISGGIVEGSEFDHDIEKVLFEADKLLYSAKEKGRNRFV
ncbi:GGDEF domain-containing protein [Evansella tamaricis]|uniref:GGDEF domain-containing protein n=1 Tax=Evansella tamaricis TaxID=2069301 RepID=A0ABS6JG13_9BACI|nr:GGDEF domain-containing protein [Evansella tamaricis]MBU9712636.1 GGDEF domain-containing protein [Evansella tamaricis]